MPDPVVFLTAPLSDDEQNTPTNTIETRPQAPLPSRARKTERSLKRRRTDQSDDEDHSAPVPALSTSSRGQSVPSAFATTSRSSNRPTIQTSVAACPLSRDSPRHVRPSGTIRSSVGPMSSRPSSHPPNVSGPASSNFPRPQASHLAVDTRMNGATQRYPALGSNGHPRSAHLHGLPVAEDTSRNHRRGFRQPPDHTFSTNTNMPSRRFPSDSALAHRMPYTNHHGMGFRARQSNYLMPAAQMGHRNDGLLESQLQNPYDGEYGDYPEYGDDDQVAWDNYENDNYDYHVGYN
jgi:hypothetical protein